MLTNDSLPSDDSCSEATTRRPLLRMAATVAAFTVAPLTALTLDTIRVASLAGQHSH